MKKKKKRAPPAGGEASEKATENPTDRGGGFSIDPESDSRTWRYPWEKAWRDGLEVKW